MEAHTGEIDLSKGRMAREENAYDEFRQYRGFYRTRLTLRCISFACCLAIIAALCNDLRKYFKTKDLTNPFKDGSGSFPVWPSNLKLWPTYILLGAAFAAGLVSLVLITASGFKHVRRMTRAGNVTTIVVSAICLTIWVAVTAYYGSWDTKKTNWDIMSWSCTHVDVDIDGDKIDFRAFCAEFRFAFWAGVGLAALEAVNLIIYVVWWVRFGRLRKYTQHDDEHKLLDRVDHHV